MNEQIPSEDKLAEIRQDCEGSKWMAMDPKVVLVLVECAEVFRRNFGSHGHKSWCKLNEGERTGECDCGFAELQALEDL